MPNNFRSLCLILLANLLVLCGCEKESSHLAKIKEVAPSLHSKLVSADKTELEKLLGEISSGRTADSMIQHVTPTGESIQVDSKLVRAAIEQRLNQ